MSPEARFPQPDDHALTAIRQAETIFRESVEKGARISLIKEGITMSLQGINPEVPVDDLAEVVDDAWNFCSVTRLNPWAEVPFEKDAAAIRNKYGMDNPRAGIFNIAYNVSRVYHIASQTSGPNR